MCILHIYIIHASLFVSYHALGDKKIAPRIRMPCGALERLKKIDAIVQLTEIQEVHARRDGIVPSRIAVALLLISGSVKLKSRLHYPVSGMRGLLL